MKHHGREHSRMKTCLRQKIPLEEHTKRAVYQGGRVWAKSMCPQMRLPNPEAFNGGVEQKQTMDGNGNG